MKATLFNYFPLFFSAALAVVIPSTDVSTLKPRASCANTPTSRGCWGEYDISTNWYDTIFSTGVTREFWLSVENTTLAPDGYLRQVVTFNGTIPGPAIVVDWGDDVVVHVTNNLQSNGTTVHWHGMRQLENSEFDGVPGVTQCPIAPGDTLTYKFSATQYGTTWYHSHFILQYGDGLVGPLIINGPATANYDEDLGVIMLQDWGHKPASELWPILVAQGGGPPTLDNTIINGTNTFNCTGSTDSNCLGTGVRFETTFVSGTKYRMRIINTAVDAHFRFSIDGHTLQVIGMDLVPIVPYNTSSILVSIGQRYDIIVNANATANNYWLRATWQTSCSNNKNAANSLGIIRYDSSSSADPTSTSTVASLASNCNDEALTSLVPYVGLNVGADDVRDVVNVALSGNLWTINSTSLEIDWSNPTTLMVYDGESPFPTDYNVVALPTADDWFYLVITSRGGPGVSHPIHLHGHDFFVLAQQTGTYSATTTVLNLVNPPRRDVATLPSGGFLAIAFQTDNPGSWLLHCHIAWHASEGLAMQFVERESEIVGTLKEVPTFQDTCTNWNQYTKFFAQDDSGI